MFRSALPASVLSETGGFLHDREGVSFEKIGAERDMQYNANESESQIIFGFLNFWF